jgi:signal transduction histidine kinase
MHKHVHGHVYEHNMRLRLRHKINGAILITSALMVFIFALIYLPFHRREMEAHMKTIQILLQTLVERDRDPLANEIFEGRVRAMSIRLEQMSNLESIQSIDIFDNTGKLLLSHSKAPAISDLSPEAQAHAVRGTYTRESDWHGQDSLMYLQKIEMIGELIGFIRIYYALEEIERETYQYLAAFCLLLISILITMGLSLNVTLSKIIIEPVTELRNIMQSFRDGRFGTQMEIRSSDEIGELGESFNLMSTELAELYQMLRTRNQELEQLDRVKDEFLANTSHEIRTPLNGIIGVAESLLSDLGSPTHDKAAHHLKMIISSARRLSNLTSDILDISKMRRGEFDLKFEAVHMGPLTAFLVDLYRPLAEAKSLRLVKSVQDDLPRVRGDKNRILQILHNLTENAIKYTNKGSVKICAETLSEKFVRVSIADTGIGISQERQQAIFEPFEQADGSATREFGGTGLGLSISRELVKAHKGEIGVQSVPGQGSEFFFTLPVWQGPDHRPPLPQVFKDDISFEGLNGSAKQTFNMSAVLQVHPLDSDSPRILIVDDDPINIEILMDYLSLKKFRVCTAFNGPDALELIQASEAEGKNFDLILLDVMMPKMSGFEVARAIRKKYNLFEMPVILVTAKDQDKDLVEGFQSGANDYVIKPVHQDELAERINVHINLQNRYNSLKRKINERTDALENALRNLEEAQEKLAANARQAGMAEIAASILHNIGNAVNSVNVRAEHMESLFGKDEIQMLEKLCELITSDSLISGDAPRREKLLKLMSLILEIFHRTDRQFKADLEFIRKGMQHITEIICIHQKYAGLRGFETWVNLNDLLRDASEMLADAFEKRGIAPELKLGDIPLIFIDKNKMMQIFINVLKNAYESIDMSREQTEKRIRVRTAMEKENLHSYVNITVADSGAGIAPELREDVFKFNFSTKRSGTGLGLHDAANYIRSQNGSVTLFSEGAEKGACLTIRLPFQEETDSSG